jgi:type IV secretory pathway VirB6-like protein
MLLFGTHFISKDDYGFVVFQKLGCNISEFKSCDLKYEKKYDFQYIAITAMMILLSIILYSAGAFRWFYLSLIADLILIYISVKLTSYVSITVGSKVVLVPSSKTLLKRLKDWKSDSV